MWYGRNVAAAPHGTRIGHRTGLQEPYQTGLQEPYHKVEVTLKHPHQHPHQHPTPTPLLTPPFTHPPRTVTLSYLVNGGTHPHYIRGNTMGNTTKGNTTTKGTKGTPPQCTFVKPEPVTPQVRKGTSTVSNPVGVTWVTCVNVTLQGGNTIQPRKVYHQTVIGVGVTYYTTRTQVNRYLQWVRGGSNPTQLPRGVVLPKGYKQPKV